MSDGKTKPAISLKSPVLAATLGWLVPGLGHLYQGRIAKGLLYAICILGLFCYGAKIGEWKIVYTRMDSEEWRWPYLAQVWTGLIALPALAQNPPFLKDPPMRGLVQATLKDFQAPPTDAQLDDLHFRVGKTLDIALVYTMVAGLLNLLAMYDALLGPAFADEESQTNENAASA